MGLSTRLQLLRAYLSRERDFPLALTDLLGGMVKPPCTTIGPRYVKSIGEDGDYYVVKIRDLAAPLYWPRSLPLFDLYKVVTESFYPADWHFYEVPETQVAPGDGVLDCGAAEGIFALRVLERAGRIAVFEPLPLFGASLRRQFAAYPKVSVVSSALGSAPGTAFLDGGSLYGVISEQSGGIEVPITTIDSWAEQNDFKVDFIKGDLEAFEFAVLRGAAETIRRYQPKIAFTVYHPGNNWREMLDFVRSLVPGYRYRVKGLSYNAAQARPVMLHLWPAEQARR